MKAPFANVGLRTAIAGESSTLDRLLIAPSWNYVTITAATAATTIKASSGILGNIELLAAGANPSVLTIYDNTAASGTVIATIDLTAIKTISLEGIPFNTGLTVAVTDAGTPDTVVLVIRYL